MNTIEEYISDLTRGIGNIYDAYENGIGDTSTPNTAQFWVQQLLQVASNNLPQFGILDTTPASFVVSSNDSGPNQYFLNISSGTVGYEGQRLNIVAQNIPIKKTWAASYNSGSVSYYQYGIRLGFSLQEAINSSQVYSTTLLNDANSGDSVIYISDTSFINTLGFPLQAHIGNMFVVFSDWNANKTGLVIDPSFYNGSSYGQINQSFNAGVRIYFIYEPRVSAIYGFPVPSVGSTNPTLFTYYPPYPDDWLSIADVLVQFASGNQDNPVVVGINRTVDAWPDANSSNPVFTPTDASKIITSCNNVISQLSIAKNSSNLGSLIQAIRQYTRVLANNNTINFRQYWANQPWTPASYFGRGISFAGLEKINFTHSFAKAYYANTGQDIQHIFGLFRGDLYNTTTRIVGGSSVSGVSATSYVSNSFDSALTKGTYIYGISAVFNSGETAPTYSSCTGNNENQEYYFNTLNWNNTSNALFYHIYRKSTTVGDQTEVRLTTPGQITSGVTFTNTSPSPTTNRTFIGPYEAFSFHPSNASYLGAIALNLKLSAAVTNLTDGINIALYTDNGSGAPGTLIQHGTAIPYSSLNNTNWTTVYSHFNHQFSDTSLYWLVLSLTNVPSTGNLLISVAAIGTNVYATSSDGSTWSNLNNISPYYRLLGYVDNGTTATYIINRGVNLTGDVAIIPQQLSVFVPPMNLSSSLAETRLPASITEGTTSNTNTYTYNEMIVTVIARNGENGTPVTFTQVVPQYTVRGTRFNLGTSTQVFDRIDSFYVAPGTNLTIGSNGQINWSPYDLVTVETVP